MADEQVAASFPGNLSPETATPSPHDDIEMLDLSGAAGQPARPDPQPDVLCSCGCGEAFTPKTPSQRYVDASHRARANRLITSIKRLQEAHPTQRGTYRRYLCGLRQDSPFDFMTMRAGSHEEHDKAITFSKRGYTIRPSSDDPTRGEINDRRGGTYVDLDECDAEICRQRIMDFIVRWNGSRGIRMDTTHPTFRRQSTDRPLSEYVYMMECDHLPFEAGRPLQFPSLATMLATPDESQDDAG